MESSCKLDQWIKRQYGARENPTDEDVAIWEAARESMRQEIIPLVYGWCESDNVAARTVEAIRKIEP